VTKPVDFPIVLARIEAQLRNRVSTAPAQTARDEIRPGATLGGRYLLIDLIGEGGFGVVYRARHTELELDVAVKLLHDNIAHNPALRERFRREGMSMCRIQHPNAVKIYDFQSTDGGATYLVMELLHGCSLGEYLVQHPALTIERCAEILMPVCELLSVAHDAGVVHRDIKPDNLFLEKVTGRETTRVLDFGIAELLDESTENLTQTGMIVGSPKYLAPERLLGDEVDSHSDIFSLGVVLYQMINGSLPFPAKNLQDRLSAMKDSDLLPMSDQVPVAITELITSALSLDPAARPDALKFAAAMMDFLPVGYHSDRHSRQLPTVSPESEVSAFPESAPQAIDPTIVVRSDRVLASAISPPPSHQVTKSPSHQQGNHSDSESPPLINILLVEDNEMNENKVNKPPIRENGQVSQL
jgi:serine/threonine protein kinase